MVKTYPFENDNTISLLDGSTNDSLISYIPKFGDSINSYMYYVLKEPILYNYFLNKNIYRLTINRSFDEPIVIRVENDGKKIKIVSKKLNKTISFPFYVYGRDWYNQHEYPEDVAILDADGELIKVINEKKYKQLIDIYKQYDDSMSKIYNVMDYKISFENESYIDKSVWDSLTYLVENANFWTSGYYSFVNYPDPDASAWVIEGHSKFGYQCIKIYSPFTSEFGNGHENKKELDKMAYQNKIKSKYAKLFKYIVSKTKLVDEKLN